MTRGLITDCSKGIPVNCCTDSNPVMIFFYAERVRLSMHPRRFLVSGGIAVLTATAGCRASDSESSGTDGPTSDTTETPTPTPGKSGTVESHITEASVVSHDAALRETEGGQQWVVTVRLRLDAQDPEVATPRPPGVFVVFIDAGGTPLYEVHKQAPLNTGDGPKTATVSARFDPNEAGQATFHGYRIELVYP